MYNPEKIDWQPAQAPSRQPLQGHYVRLEPLDTTRHGDDLWQALQGPEADPVLWDYLPYGPFPEREAFNTWLAGHEASRDPLFFCVIDLASNKAVGLLSLMSIVPKDGRIEIGHVAFGAPMQRTIGATETFWLLASLAMDTLGYRRLEWKCNANNARSMRAAERLGFRYEGTFRQHLVDKGANRDTAWFSIIDSEWPDCRSAFSQWLSPANFAADGAQLKHLDELRNAPAN